MKKRLCAMKDRVLFGAAVPAPTRGISARNHGVVLPRAACFGCVLNVSGNRQSLNDAVLSAALRVGVRMVLPGVRPGNNACRSPNPGHP